MYETRQKTPQITYKMGKSTNQVRVKTFPDQYDEMREKACLVYLCVLELNE